MTTREASLQYDLPPIHCAIAPATRTAVDAMLKNISRYQIASEKDALSWDET